MNRIGVRIRDSALSIADMRDLACLAEARGLESVWLPENMGRDALAELIVLAQSTTRIRVGTGILPVFGRFPTQTAAAVATAAAAAPGRVVLGLGIGHRDALVRGHGVDFQAPLERTAEFARIVRELLSGGEVTDTGGIFAIERFRLEDRPAPPVPVFIAALRPRMLRLAGAIADGVLLNWVHLDHLPRAIEYVREGAEAAGRSLEALTIASYLRTCVTDAPEQVERASREQIAQYGSMVYYRRYFSDIGFEAESQALAAAWARGDRDAAIASVTAPMVRDLTVYGSAEQCRTRLQAYRDAGLQLPIIAPFPVGEAVQDTFARTIEGCAIGPERPTTA
jgi:probable F420-dependent oxidoreductase